MRKVLLPICQNLTSAFFNRISDMFSEIFLGRVFIGQGKGFEFWDKYLPLFFAQFHHCLISQALDFLGTQFNQCSITLVLDFTSAPFHQCSISPVLHFTGAPFHRCSISLVAQITMVLIFQQLNNFLRFYSDWQAFFTM